MEHIFYFYNYIIKFLDIFTFFIVPVKRSSRNIISAEEDKEICWKMKPSVILNSSNSNATGKKLKQMTLSLARPEKKHDISLSHKFKGGIANIQTDHKDMVPPSPERLLKRGFTRFTSFKFCVIFRD